MNSSLLLRSTLVLGTAVALIGAGCGTNTASSPAVSSPTAPSGASPTLSSSTPPVTNTTTTPELPTPATVAPATTAAVVTPSSTTQPTVKTTPPREPAPTANTYTLQEVATHKDAGSCWTVINGKVYDVTAWIAQHPGGERGILSLCGKDGTNSFSGQHGGQAGPLSALARFQIGTLK